MRPKVSVIMNCFNGQKYMKEAIQSLLAQSYQNWELIFWDNNSNDKSVEIIEEINDCRFKIFKSQNHTNLCIARNSALKRSSGNLITFLDVDDFWHPDKLSNQVQNFGPNVGASYSNYWIYNENKKSKLLFTENNLPSGDILDLLLKNYFIGLVTLMISREALDAVGGKFDEDFHIIGDFDLVIKISEKFDIVGIQDAFGTFRSHDQNETKNKIKLQAEELFVWINKIKDHHKISSSPNFKNVEDFANYLNILGSLLQGNKKQSFDLLIKEPINIKTLKLLGALFVPTKWLLKFRT